MNSCSCLLLVYWWCSRYCYMTHRPSSYLSLIGTCQFFSRHLPYLMNTLNQGFKTLSRNETRESKRDDEKKKKRIQPEIFVRSLTSASGITFVTQAYIERFFLHADKKKRSWETNILPNIQKKKLLHLLTQPSSRPALFSLKIASFHQPMSIVHSGLWVHQKRLYWQTDRQNKRLFSCHWTKGTRNLKCTLI